MGLTEIRAEAKRYTDKVFAFTNGDIDAAVNTWYLTCWRHLDRVAPNRTRTSEDLALVADQRTIHSMTTAPLAIIEIQPPFANRNQFTFIAAIDDMAFQRHTNASEVLYAQVGEKDILVRPAMSSNLTVSVHFIRKPPVITTSQDQLHFMDQTLAAGAIGRLLHSLNFPDALYWLDERAPGFGVGTAFAQLREELVVFNKFGNNSNLSMRAVGGFTSR